MNRSEFGNLLLAGVVALCFVDSATATLIPGPDAFGYSSQSIPFNLRDVSVSGNSIGLDNTDDATAVVPIGFSFPFYGTNYTQVEVSSNGFMSFTPTGHTGAGDFGHPIPTAGAIDNFIAGWFDDLNLIQGGKIRTKTVGSVGSREFIAGFYQVRDFDHPTQSINTFEMILHEGTGNIELQLGQIQWDDFDNKVIGIENATGTVGLQVAFFPHMGPGHVNGDILFQNQAYLISRVPEPGTLALAVMLSISLVGARAVRHERRGR